MTNTGLTRQSKGMGQRAPTPGQREHRHRPRRKQSRSGRRAAGQARRPCRRRRGIRKRSQSPLLRNIRQDRRERQGALHRDRKEAAHRASQPEGYARRWRQAGRCGPWQEGRCRHCWWRRWMPVLEDGSAAEATTTATTVLENDIRLLQGRRCGLQTSLMFSLFCYMGSAIPKP